ncbi:hypothetical protein AURDEDRAFT_173503 [Auricularia subglabra TFB-10046 SS5]|nr:hypothetical protein AURDEDRAFT_173503 [Auricularia subglabra TFB-10046 SS5]
MLPVRKSSGRRLSCQWSTPNVVFPLKRPTLLKSLTLTVVARAGPAAPPPASYENKFTRLLRTMYRRLQRCNGVKTGAAAASALQLSPWSDGRCARRARSGLVTRSFLSGCRGTAHERPKPGSGSRDAGDLAPHSRRRRRRASARQLRGEAEAGLATCFPLTALTMANSHGAQASVASHDPCRVCLMNGTGEQVPIQEPPAPLTPLQIKPPRTSTGSPAIKPWAGIHSIGVYGRATVWENARAGPSCNARSSPPPSLMEVRTASQGERARQLLR